MGLFKRNLTKWIPLGSYNHADVNYIIFARKNISTGMVKFKTKRVHGRLAWCTTILPTGMIDTQKAWDNLMGGK